MKPRWRESPPARLLALGLIGIAFAAWHHQAARRGRISAPERLVLAVLQPVQVGLNRLGAALGGEWQSFTGWRELMRENRSLKRQVAQLGDQNHQLLRYRDENLRLRKMLALDPGVPARRLAAEVTALEVEHGARRVWINRGGGDGIRGDSETKLTPTGDPVISESGLVGHVLRCDNSRSYVLLLTDRLASVGARCVRSGAVGILKGTGDGCRLENLDQNADIREGDTLITSGLGGVFPKGLHIGKVATVRKDIRRPTQIADVEPAAALDRLDQVFVLTTADNSRDRRAESR